LEGVYEYFRYGEAAANAAKTAAADADAEEIGAMLL
jgi:hypothetical protein